MLTLFLINATISSINKQRIFIMREVCNVTKCLKTKQRTNCVIFGDVVRIGYAVFHINELNAYADGCNVFEAISKEDINKIKKEYELNKRNIPNEADLIISDNDEYLPTFYKLVALGSKNPTMLRRAYEFRKYEDDSIGMTGDYSDRDRINLCNCYPPLFMMARNPNLPPYFITKLMHDRDVGVREELSAQTHLDNEYYFMMLMDEAETVRANATRKILTMPSNDISSDVWKLLENDKSPLVNHQLIQYYKNLALAYKMSAQYINGRVER